VGNLAEYLPGRESHNRDNVRGDGVIEAPHGMIAKVDLLHHVLNEQVALDVFVDVYRFKIGNWLKIYIVPLKGLFFEVHRLFLRFLLEIIKP
jgi:hypothetical protein